MASVTFPKFPKREKTGNAGFSRNSRAPFRGAGRNGNGGKREPYPMRQRTDPPILEHIKRNKMETSK